MRFCVEMQMHQLVKVRYVSAMDVDKKQLEEWLRKKMRGYDENGESKNRALERVVKCSLREEVPRFANFIVELSKEVMSRTADADILLTFVKSR